MTARSRRDRGFVTAETAVVLPVLVAVLVFSLWALACVTAQLRCVDAARVAARLAARGESDARVLLAARTAAPDGAQVRTTLRGETVDVTVEVRVRPLGGLVLVPPVTLRAQSSALLEQGAP